MDVGAGDVDMITVQSLLEHLEKAENQRRQLSPSIYMVPSTLRDQNPSCYKPRLVSIGPLHRKDENLQASEEEKAIYAISLLNRVGEATREETLQACTLKVNVSIDNIRCCYADTITYNDIELAKMMVIDACFILEFLYRVMNNEKAKIMFFKFIMCDLLLLENQIPFFVLEDIFECTISKFDPRASLISAVRIVLNWVNPFKGFSDISYDTRPPHILGFLHHSFENEKGKSFLPRNGRLPSAIELDRAGVKFMPMLDKKWPLTMKVKSRNLPWFSSSWGSATLMMPVLDISDITELLLRNLIAYEQLPVTVTQYFTPYAYFMDMLIDSGDDIARLVESEVLVNNVRSTEDAAAMINNICKDLACRDFFYDFEWLALLHHYKRYWPRNMAWLRRTYFNNPWNVIALLAGIALFVLTVMQTFYTIKPAGSN